MTDWTALEMALDDRGPYKWSELVDRDTLRALLAELREAHATSEGRRKTVVEKADELTAEWKRAERAEAEVARLTADGVCDACGESLKPSEARWYHRLCAQINDEAEENAVNQDVRLSAQVTAWQDRFKAIVGESSPDSAGNAVITLQRQVTALQGELAEAQECLANTQTWWDWCEAGLIDVREERDAAREAPARCGR